MTIKVLSCGFSLVLLGLLGCSDINMEDKTTVGAATGGVLGAGLGAIIGSQTGSAGTGLVIGALAGAGTGAAIGDTLQTQDQLAQNQDEKIRLQEERLKAHEREIQELRQGGQDSGYRGSDARGQLRSPEPARKPLAETDLTPSTASRSSELRVTNPNTIQPRLQPALPVSTDSVSSVTTERSTVWEKPAVVEAQPEKLSEPTPAKVLAQVPASSECSQANDEVNQAAQTNEAADKLFHYRRALRLCPDNASYHNGLGEVYLSLGRREDAEFEFREALNREPDLKSARQNLDGLQGARY